VLFFCNYRRGKMYEIYIKKISLNGKTVHKIFVFLANKLVWLNAFHSEDAYNTIEEGVVTQTFRHNKLKVKLLNGVEVFVESKQHAVCGDRVTVQLKALPIADMVDKHIKATFNVALPIGPVILYPFQSGISCSRRAQIQDFNSIEDQLRKENHAMGIKLRKSFQEYSLDILKQIISFGERVWKERTYNAISFKILNDIFSFLNKDTAVFSNDMELLELLVEESSALLGLKVLTHALENDETLDAEWDRFAALTFPLDIDGGVCIEETKACVCVDINGGSSGNPLTVNLDAVKQLPQHLVFGRFGGKCVVDLVGMHKKADYGVVVEKCKAEFEKLNVAAQVFGVTPMGILEIILPRRGYPLWWINKNFQES
jgi:Ribonuclease G/E